MGVSSNWFLFNNFTFWHAKRFYVFGVTNEKNPPNITETLVNSHCVLAYIENVESTEQLCEILQFLHHPTRAILHLDLKPDNILVSNHHLKLIDYLINLNQ